MPVSPGLLMLADSRLPAGGHVHSGGLEAAIAAGAVTEPDRRAGPEGSDGLEPFLRGRLLTAGLVSAGLTNAAVAARLAISEKTVKNHLNSVFAKLRVRTRTEAVIRWRG